MLNMRKKYIQIKLPKGAEKHNSRYFSLKARLVILDNSQVNVSCLDIFTGKIRLIIDKKIFPVPA